ncbi:tyrosinase [Pelobates cultripes]|uniref:Tyrosinase n=1 Tax=Pelobates cultripes TaxID=61616 RepID=A0AAD1R908_PELCU|nr:tyrosinase [Pelobates cultripes]
MLTVGVLLLFLGTVIATFPRECTTPEALRTYTCCPLLDGSPCGYNSGRGICQIIPQSRAKGNNPLSYDDRYSWPLYYFNRTCRCFGNYGQYNCGYCKSGWWGSDCSKRIELVRRELREYSLVERKTFFAYLHYCKTKISKEYVILTTGDRFYKDTFQFKNASYYDIAAFLHYYAIKPAINNSQVVGGLNYAHASSGFLTWHRLYILFFEHLMRICTGVETFTCPYNDWQDDSGCALCTNDFIGDSNEQGKLSEFSIFSRWKVSYDFFIKF